jgi:hypothetical protein
MVMRASLIILDHSRQATRGNKMSTFRSRLTVSDLRSCKRIFKNYLSTLMMRSSNDILYTSLHMNPEDIDVTADFSPTDGSPDMVPEPMTDDYNIFQRDIILYSQLMSQMTIDQSVGTSSIQYEPPRTLSSDTLAPLPEFQRPNYMKSKAQMTSPWNPTERHK